MERFDGEEVGKENFDGAGMVMDAATDATYTVISTALPIIISKDGGKTYATSETLGGPSLSNDVTDGVISTVGIFTEPKSDGIPHGVEGVARSEDGGDSWAVFEVPGGDVRFGAYPSKDTWYVTSGMFGGSTEAAEGVHQLSARAAVSASGVQFKERKHFNANDTVTGGGYTAFISKTTDGGATWSTVFPNDPSNFFYFNAIDCSSDLHCVAVAEGDDADGEYDIRAYVTFDGGESWNNAIPKSTWPEDTVMVSIAGAAWVDDNEGWLGATAKNRGLLQAQFFHTTDGGKTYTVEQQLDDCYIMDIDFATNTGSTVGYASCIGSSGATSSMAMYV